MRDKPLILLVDDEKDFLEIMATKLTGKGFEPVVAHNAEEAIDAAKKLDPDLILMDIHMPGETGTDAALAINQNPETKHIKIVFLSSLKDPWPMVMGDRNTVVQELGATAFIDKTTDLDEIILKVKELLQLPSGVTM